jgi:hypothetical protein
MCLSAAAVEDRESNTRRGRNHDAIANHGQNRAVGAPDALQDIMESGTSQIKPKAILQRFPARVGDYHNSIVPLEEWASSRSQWAIDVFSERTLLDKRGSASVASLFISNLSHIAGLSRNRATGS